MLDEIENSFGFARSRVRSIGIVCFVSWCLIFFTYLLFFAFSILFSDNSAVGSSFGSFLPLAVFHLIGLIPLQYWLMVSLRHRRHLASRASKLGAKANISFFELATSPAALLYTHIAITVLIILSLY